MVSRKRLVIAIDGEVCQICIYEEYLIVVFRVIG